MNSTRRLVYGVFIVTAVASAGGRLLSSQLVVEPSIHRQEGEAYAADRPRIWPKVAPRPMPNFGSNDRSRWATIRNLVDEGTFAIGTRDRGVVLQTSILPLGQADPLTAIVSLRAGNQFRIQSDHGTVFRDGWLTIDKVLHPKTLEYHSSKPPLLSTILAGLYWLLKQILGWTFDDHPFALMRCILIVVNLIPFGIYLACVARLAERFGTTDWGRFYVLAAAAFGTMLTPFQITFNNHTIATYCVLFALVSVLDIWTQRREYPFAQPRRLSFAAAGLFVAFAACNELPALALTAALFAIFFAYYPGRTLLYFAPAAIVPLAAFLAVNYAAVGQLRPVQSEFPSAFAPPPTSPTWYEFEGSHWRRPNPGEVRNGIDFARYKETRLDYAFHVLAGHHGWFSLCPIWLLAGVPMIWLCFRRPSPEGYPWFLAPMSVLISAVVIAFYLLKSDNYGGWTVGPRWLMWLTPLWLMFLLPAADRLATFRFGRVTAYACLAVSVVSAHYSPWNPWRHPWIYDLMLACGWAGY